MALDTPTGYPRAKVHRCFHGYNKSSHAFRVEHGTRSRYVMLGCRCGECREANALYHRLRRHRFWHPGRLVHGKYSTYINYRCRCELCSAARKAVAA